MGFWDVFHNTTAVVQIVMLLTVLGIFAAPFYLLVNWLQLRHKTRLPSDIIFAIRQEGDMMNLHINRGTPINNQNFLNLVDELAALKNGPTETQ